MGLKCVVEVRVRKGRKLLDKQTLAIYTNEDHARQFATWVYQKCADSDYKGRGS